MLARAHPALSLVFLCACQGNYPKAAQCAADGGCVKPKKCSDEACRDAGPQERAGSASRTQSTLAGMDDAAIQDDGSKDAATKRDDSAPAGSQSKPAPTKPVRDSGADAADEKNAVACETSCGECQRCSEDGQTCRSVTGRDDADSCSDTRSCSSQGQCLYVREQQSELGSTLEWVELTQTCAQVVTFSESTTVQEIRLEVSCTDNDQLFPPAWIAAAPGGTPSDTIVATANVVSQSPSDAHSFAVLELSKTLEAPAGETIAIVVGRTDMSCILRVNKGTDYAHGALFEQSTAGDWGVSEGSLVFQVLSSR